MSPQLLILAQERVALLCQHEHFGLSSWAKGNIYDTGQSTKETKLFPFISTMGSSLAVGKKIMRINK